MGIHEGKFVDLGMPSSGKKAFLWTTENSAMSGSRASQEHEQRPCVDMVDRSGHLYWMIRIPASQHLRRMGATATSVSCVESVSGVGPSHTLRMGSTPSSGYGTQHNQDSLYVVLLSCPRSSYCSAWRLCIKSTVGKTPRSHKNQFGGRG